MREEKKEVAEEGKELLRRKLKQLKITLNEKIVNDLVVFFKLKTSLDLFFRVGIGSIDNQMLKDFAASRSNTFINFFKNRIGKKQQAPEDIHKDEITSKYELLFIGKE